MQSVKMKLGYGEKYRRLVGDNEETQAEMAAAIGEEKTMS
jgi:hypothetical protein